MLDKSKDHFLAHWVLGQVLRDRGQLTKADEQFLWFINTYSKRSEDDMEITDPELLRLVGLAAAERARWYHLTEQFKFILKDVYAESVKHDKIFWWGEYEAGRLFLEKYNKADAEKALDRALIINPRAAEALACKGILAMQRLELTEAEHYADRALAINPRLTMALRLKADIFLFGGDITQAMQQLGQGPGRQSARRGDAGPRRRLLARHQEQEEGLRRSRQGGRGRTIRRRPFSTTIWPS